MIDGIKVWCIKATVRVSTPRGCSSDAQLMIIESTSVVAQMIIYSVSENQGTFSDYHYCLYSDTYFICAGGYWDHRTISGIFIDFATPDYEYQSWFGSRLSKII